MKYHFKLHKEKGGYWAECLELKECYTQSTTINELKENMEEALNVYLDEPSHSKTIFPLPDKKLKGKNIFEVSVDLKIAFGLQLRQLRLKNKLTQKQVAKKLGFKNLYSYQRLESGANPELTTLAQIKKVFREIDIEEISN